MAFLSVLSVIGKETVKIKNWEGKRIGGIKAYRDNAYM